MFNCPLEACLQFASPGWIILLAKLRARQKHRQELARRVGAWRHVARVEALMQVRALRPARKGTQTLHARAVIRAGRHGRSASGREAGRGRQEHGTVVQCKDEVPDRMRKVPPRQDAHERARVCTAGPWAH